MRSKHLPANRADLKRSKLSASGHLSTTSPEAKLTQLEFSLEHLVQAYYRWKSLCFRAVSNTTLSGEDVAVLNTIRMGETPKQLSEIANLLNRTDIANLQYALRKLMKAGLIENSGSKSRRETKYRVTSTGRSITDAYSRMRAEILIPLVAAGRSALDFAMIDRALGALARHYEDAAHGAIVGRHRTDIALHDGPIGFSRANLR